MRRRYRVISGADSSRAPRNDGPVTLPLRRGRGRGVEQRRRYNRPLVSRLARWSDAHLKQITIAILAAGFGAAIVVYFFAASRPENPLGYDPLDTKRYLHDLEVYGGKANVFAAEFRDWFIGLWYGKNLAYTIAVLTLLLVGAVRLVTALSLAELDEEEEGESRNPWPPHRGDAA